MKRVIALVLRYKIILLCRIRKQKAEFTKNVSVKELQSAETSIIIYLQRQHFPMLFDSIDGKEPTKSLPRFLQNLCPKIIDGLVHVGGRLSQAPIDFETKYPIILPQHSQFAELLIRQHHAEVRHLGINHTWASFRDRDWIVKGGAEVRKCIRKCVLCRKRNASVSK